MKDKHQISGSKTDDTKNYEKLFAEWYAPLCNYAYSILRDEDDAKDMVQKTFYKLWDQRNELIIHTSIKSYLYRMVHNNCMNKIKEYRVRAEHHQILAYEGNNTNAENTDAPMLNAEFEQKVASAIELLPPRCKEVFKMSRFQQLSYAEIAQKLAISPNTVETQIVKALRMLRKQLIDYLPLLFLFLLNKNSL